MYILYHQKNKTYTQLNLGVMQNKPFVNMEKRNTSKEKEKENKKFPYKKLNRKEVKKWEK